MLLEQIVVCGGLPSLDLLRSFISVRLVKKISWLLSPFAERREVHGEVLDLIRISRTEMGAYLCIAQNGVPPSISKRIILTVECE